MKFCEEIENEKRMKSCINELTAIFKKVVNVAQEEIEENRETNNTIYDLTLLIDDWNYTKYKYLKEGKKCLEH